MPHVRFRVGPVLDDLVDGVVLAEELEGVLLSPAQSQPMHDLGWPHGGIEVGNYRDLLVLVA